MSDKGRYLTKSRFITAFECPKKLFYLDNPDKYPNAKADDSFLKALAEGGFQVGALAKLYYPDGYEITEKDRARAVEQTNELLKKENVIIYEAAISCENLYIRVDILEKKGKQINLIEVKAKSFDEETKFTKTKGGLTSEWEKYLYDIAFQNYVIDFTFSVSQLQYNVDSYLMLADKSKEATVNGLNQLFLLVKDGDKIKVKTKEGITAKD